MTDEHPREAYQGPHGHAGPGRGAAERQRCRKRAGISRSHYYEIKETFEKYGREGLAPQTRRGPRMPNETPPELVDKILEMTERYPTYSYVRISQQLRLVGVGVSPSAVRYVWQRHGLTLRYQRLVRNPLSLKKLVYLDGQQAHERSHPRSRPASHAVLRRVREPRPG